MYSVILADQLELYWNFCFCYYLISLYLSRCEIINLTGANHMALCINRNNSFVTLATKLQIFSIFI